MRYRWEINFFLNLPRLPRLDRGKGLSHNDYRSLRNSCENERNDRGNDVPRTFTSVSYSSFPLRDRWCVIIRVPRENLTREIDCYFRLDAVAVPTEIINYLTFRVLVRVIT